jgi:hypothetical protein
MTRSTVMASLAYQATAASRKATALVLNQWGDIIPAEFQVYPLLDPEAMKDFLETQT